MLAWVGGLDLVENATYLEKYLKKLDLEKTDAIYLEKVSSKNLDLGKMYASYLFGKVSSKHLDLGKMYAIYLERYLQKIMDLIGGNATHS